MSLSTWSNLIKRKGEYRQDTLSIGIGLLKHYNNIFDVPSATSYLVENLLKAASFDIRFSPSVVGLDHMKAVNSRFLPGGTCDLLFL
jgi:hypothetical protein